MVPGWLVDDIIILIDLVLYTRKAFDSPQQQWLSFLTSKQNVHRVE